ncbi:hypothetical protein ACQEXU_10735 [Vibrio sp. TRT 21S02]|uniref:hypothetical protein n=1 Tax=Vibrio sp. TRT 21S02 TaxID=3418507 RepID=UPI003CF0E92B
MHKLRNGSQVTVRPARKPVIGTPGYFSESNDEGAPSIPGQDWFNDCIDEFLNALAAAGITYDPNVLTNLSQAISALGKNAVYDELVGMILPDSTIQVSRDRAFLADGSEYNRADYPKLWNKISGTGILVSQAVINADPETNAAKYGDGDGSTTFTLPNYGLRPHLAAAGTLGSVGTTIEDQIQNITGAWESINFSSTTKYQGAVDGTIEQTGIVGSGSLRYIMNHNFDASRVVRTGTYTEVNSSFLNFYIIHGESA